jgi:hypothetical protein
MVAVRFLIWRSFAENLWQRIFGMGRWNGMGVEFWGIGWASFCAAGTLLFWFVIEAWLDWGSLPWWLYLILWLIISGSTHSKLLQDDANQKIVDD